MQTSQQRGDSKPGEYQKKQKKNDLQPGICAFHYDGALWSIEFVH
jgi:hypothetical protein